MNSIKDLIIFNDHQYTKNTNSIPIQQQQQQQQSISNLNNPTIIIQSSPSSIQSFDTQSINSNLPPLSIEEILNDNQSDYSQDLSPNYCVESSPFYDTMESSSLMETNDTFLNDNYFSLDQPALVSFDF